LQRHSARLPLGRALDVACGDGRNTLYLARQHFAVDAVDIALAGLMRAKREAYRQGLSACFIQADLDSFPLPVDRYDVVVNVRYLNRHLLPALKKTVREGGMVVFETFLREQAELGHPRNPDFLLERGELGLAFNDFDVLAYEEGLFQTEKDGAFLARVLARRPVDWEPD
jgi:SAM-dependent methyltransferase